MLSKVKTQLTRNPGYRWMFLPWIVYLFSRLLYLARLPLFIDEAVHIRWAQRMLAGDVLRSLNVGKPLEPLLVVPGLLLGVDALWWARWVHVVAGAGTLTLLMLMQRHVASRKVVGMSVLLYLVLPYALFYDRIALTEAYLAFAGMLVLWSTLQMLSTSKRLWVIITALALVLCFAAKMPVGIFFTIVPVVFGVLWPPENAQRLRLGTLLIVYGPIALVLMGVGAVAFLRARQGLSPGFGLGLVDAQASVVGLAGIFRRSLTNLGSVVAWGGTYFTWPLLLLAGIGLIWALWKGPNLYRGLALLVLAGTAPFVVIADRWWPRYLFFLTPALCLLMAHALGCAGAALRQRVKSKLFNAVAVLALCVLLLPPVLRSVTLIIRPERARLPDPVRQAFVEGVYAGYGYPEAADWLVENEPPFLIVCFSLGNYVQLDTYLPHPHSLEVTQVHVERGQARDAAQRVQRIVELLDERETVYVFLNAQRDDLGGDERGGIGIFQEYALTMVPLASFPRPGGGSSLEIYRLSAP